MHITREIILRSESKYSKIANYPNLKKYSSIASVLDDYQMNFFILKSYLPNSSVQISNILVTF